MGQSSESTRPDPNVPKPNADMKFVILSALVAVALARPQSSNETYVVSEEVVHPGDDAIESQGQVQFVHPNGEEFVLTYVSNAEGGYQPQSAALPVAPAFPHPIPDFVLAQIEKAAREDADRSDEK